MRIMAIDYGDARTGVALSDPTGFLAGQTFLVKSRKEEVVLAELSALARREGAEELVLYRWNRSYPGDVTFPWPLTGWKLVETADFPGTSHEKITEEVYRP